MGNLSIYPKPCPILKALAKAPEDRYQSADEMSRALDRAVRGVPGKEAETAAAAAFTEARWEEPRPEVASLPTVAMEQGESAEEEPVTSAEELAPAEPADALPLARRTCPRIIIGAVAGLVVIAILAVFLSDLVDLGGASMVTDEAGQGASTRGGTSGREFCATVDECVGEAFEFMEREDYDNAVARLDRAIEMAADGERPPHAHLWCIRGEVSVVMDRVDEARRDFEHCIEWTEGDPGLEELRLGAEEQLMMLERR